MTATAQPTGPSNPVIGYMVVNSITGASPFVMDEGNHTVTFTGMTAPLPLGTTAVGLNITNPGNKISFLSYGLTGAASQFLIAQNDIARITFDTSTQLSLQPAGGNVVIGASGTTANLMVQGNASVNGNISADSLNVQNSLLITGNSGAVAAQIIVTKAISVSGASASMLSAGTGTIVVQNAQAGSLNAGTGAITVSSASAASLNTGTGTISVQNANAAIINAGTGSIVVQNAQAGILNAGTGTITVSSASAASLNTGTGTISVQNANAATINAGTGSIVVQNAQAGILNAGTGTITVSSASAASLNTGTGTISVQNAQAGILNAGTGTITVSSASAASLNTGTGTISVQNANAATINAGTGTIVVRNAQAGSLNAGTGTITVSSASAASLNAGTGSIVIGGATAGSVSSGTLYVGSTATFNSNTQINGLLSMVSGSITLGGPATSPTATNFTQYGAMQLNGNVQVNSSIQIGKTAAFQPHNVGVQINNGTLVVTNGGLYTKKAATLDGGAQFSGTLSTINGSVVIGGPATSPTATNFMQYGAMQLNGNVQVNNSIQIGNTAAFQPHNVGVQINNGTLVLTNGGLYAKKAVTLDGGAQFSGTLSTINGSVVIGGPATSPTALQMTVYGAMAIGNSGSINYNNGALNVLNNLNVVGNIQINGTPVISATGIGSSSVKSFIIQHPRNQEKFLIHATLEGPENAVFYRGTAQLKNGTAKIKLPAYFESLTRKEDRSIILSNVDSFDKLAIKTIDGYQIKNGSFIVVSENPASEQTFNWEVKAVRKDVDHLDVEPEKSKVSVTSFGPYTYAAPKKETVN